MSAKISNGHKIKSLREESKLSQIQIANFIGVDQSFISKCEKDERQLNIDSLEKLCNLFGCEIADFINKDTVMGTVNFAFRSSSIDNEDLVAISEINKIALNIQQMKKLLEDK